MSYYLDYLFTCVYYLDYLFTCLLLHGYLLYSLPFLHGFVS